MVTVPTKTTPEVAVQGGPNVIQSVQGANDPDAFGAGVGRAISGVGATALTSAERSSWNFHM